MERKTGGSDEGLRQSEERYRLLVESVRDYAIFMLDPAGKVLTWNAGAERFKGYSGPEIVGRHFSVFYPEEARQKQVPENALRTAAKVGVFEDEGWRLRKDGTRFWANVVITALKNAQGELVGFAKVTRDLTQHRAHEEELRLSEESFRLFVQGVPEYAFCNLDAAGRISTWNIGAERVTGYTAEEITGQHFSIFYPPDVRDSGWTEHELGVAAEKGTFVDTGWRVRKDGSNFWANMVITALYDDSRTVIGYSQLTRDMSDTKPGHG